MLSTTRVALPGGIPPTGQNMLHATPQGYALYQPMLDDVSYTSPRKPEKPVSPSTEFEYPPGATVTRLIPRPEVTSAAALAVQYHSELAAYNAMKPMMVFPTGNAEEQQQRSQAPPVFSCPTPRTPPPTATAIRKRPQRMRAPAENIRNGLLAHTFGATISADWNQCATKRQRYSCLSLKELLFWKA